MRGQMSRNLQKSIVISFIPVKIADMKKINIKEIDTKRIFCTLLPPVMAFTVNCMVYWGAPLFTVGRTAYNLSGNLDDLVPFLPPFIVVYLGCYIFWVINYLLISAQGDEHRYRFFTADICSRLVCLVIFVVFPTTNTRPELIGHDIWTQAVRALYQWDAPQNLFPSIHCLVSWMCCIGLRGCDRIPKWYKWVSKFIAVLVFVSTLALRQHVLIDVAGGILLAELACYISNRRDGYKLLQKVTETVAGWIVGRLSGKKNGK